ncbi:MAG TPA: ABC transporter substrate-binding protein [Sphingobacteriaceae bacterium]
MSGNKFLFFFLVVFFVSCSRKVAPPVIKHPDEPGELPKAEQQPVIELEPRIHSIGLVLPFYSRGIDPRAVSNAEVRRADIALEFYQGFKLAIDSLSSAGGNFQLQVVDAGDDPQMLSGLARSGSIQAQDLIIGPVFPDGIRVLSELVDFRDKVMVSPLAASSPATFKNPALVTLNNGIDQHAARLAAYIRSKYNQSAINLVLINTRSADDQKFAVPFKNELDRLSKGTLKITEVVNTQGIEQRLVRNKTNVLVVASDELKFVRPTVYRLYRLKTDHKYSVDLYGHPNWSRLNLDAAQLQALSTTISSSYHVDYQSEAVKRFVARYRLDYWEEPTEYAFKGFDTGYFFGSLLMKYGKEYVQNIGSSSYHGLHSDFLFSYDGQYGFRNIHLMMLQYKGFELKPVP